LCFSAASLEERKLQTAFLNESTLGGIDRFMDLYRSTLAKTDNELQEISFRIEELQEERQPLQAFVDNASSPNKNVKVFETRSVTISLHATNATKVPAFPNHL
jgi:hypothetical protein